MIVKYLCVTKCWWMNTLWYADKTYSLDSNLKPPHHFERLDGDVTTTKEKALKRYRDELQELLDLVEADKKKGKAATKTHTAKIEQLRERISEIEGPKEPSKVAVKDSGGDHADEAGAN